MDICGKHSPISTVRFSSAAASFSRWVEKETAVICGAIAIGRREIQAGRGDVRETENSVRTLESERAKLLRRLSKHPFSRGILDSGPPEAKRTLIRACRTLQHATATAPQQSRGSSDAFARLAAIQRRLSAFRRPTSTSTSSTRSKPRAKRPRFDPVADIQFRQRRWNWDKANVDKIARLRVYWNATKMSAADQAVEIELLWLQSLNL